MDLESPLRSLENIFTRPSLGRIAFLLVLALLAFVVEYGTGFSHHYDVRSQIQELNQLEAASEDSATIQQIDSLRAEVLKRVERRQSQMSRDSLWYWQLLSALTLPFVLLVTEFVLLLRSGSSSVHWRQFLLSFTLCGSVYLIADVLPVPSSFTAAVILPLVVEIIILTGLLVGFRVTPDLPDPFNG